MKKTEFQTMLDNEPSIKNWLDQIVTFGRRHNISFSGIYGEKLIFEKGGNKEIVDLKQDINEIKNNLLSVKEKFPIPANNQ